MSYNEETFRLVPRGPFKQATTPSSQVPTAPADGEEIRKQAERFARELDKMLHAPA